MKKIYLAITVLFICISMATQAWISRPVSVPDGTMTLQSLSFNPVGRWGNPESTWRTTSEKIEADLRRISTLTSRVRLYTLDYGLDQVPAMAERLGMRVTLGVWVDPKDMTRTRREMEAAVRLAREYPHVVDNIIVGNEVILREEMSVDELGALMNEMRIRTGKPVSTGEPIGIWAFRPGLARYADYIAGHVLPYWGNHSPEDAVRISFQEFEQMRAQFPGMPAEIAEFGWPSGRFNRGAARTSPLDQAAIIRQFSVEAARRGVTYNIVEAFDQPWKTNEGAVGPYWGIFDGHGQRKFEQTGPVSPNPTWHVQASLGIIIGLVIGLFWTLTRPTLAGASITAFVSQAIGAMIAWGLSDILSHYWTMGILLSWVIGVPMMLFLSFVFFERIREILDVVQRRPEAPNQNSGHIQGMGMVSIHVPARSEKPEVVAACLRALSRLEWPDYEVILVLNNTRDEELVNTLRQVVENLGPKFRMVYAPVLSGFKAGALNLALRETSERAEWIAVVDADYQVNPDWLQKANALVSPKVSLVQFPQEHFDDNENPVRAGMNDEYATFFDAGMVQRAMDQSLIVHGTMVLVRMSAMKELKGWSENHICEDTELGLRLLRNGHEMVYSTERAGRGLLPDDMNAFRKQRDRWVYGGMRIAISHAKALLMPGGGLSVTQKYHFLSGWLGWVGDAAALVASIATLAWAALMLSTDFGEPPPPQLSLVIIAAALVSVVHTLALHMLRVKRGLGAAMRAMVVGLSLQAVVGLAVIRGLLIPGLPFHVTSKGGQGSGLMSRLSSVRFEASMLMAQLGVAGYTAWENMFLSVNAIWIFVALILVQSMPNLAAVMLALTDRPWVSSSNRQSVVMKIRLAD